VVNYTTIEATRQTQTRTKFTISIPHELMPSFYLLVFFVHDNGELVADLMQVKVKCELKEKVKENQNLN